MFPRGASIGVRNGLQRFVATRFFLSCNVDESDAKTRQVLCNNSPRFAFDRYSTKMCVELNELLNYMGPRHHKKRLVIAVEVRSAPRGLLACVIYVRCGVYHGPITHRAALEGRWGRWS